MLDQEIKLVSKFDIFTANKQQKLLCQRIFNLKEVLRSMGTNDFSISYSLSQNTGSYINDCCRYDNCTFSTLIEIDNREFFIYDYGAKKDNKPIVVINESVNGKQIFEDYAEYDKIFEYLQWISKYCLLYTNFYD